MRKHVFSVDDPEIFRIKDRAWESLNKVPGVHAVGIGAKVVGGVRTDELAIVVFVVTKKPLDQLQADEVVPSEIEGVKTDVVQMSQPRLLARKPNISVKVDPRPATGGATVILTTDRNPPELGQVVVITVLLTPVAPGKPPKRFFSSRATNGKSDLAQIAQSLAFGFSLDLPITATNLTGSTEIGISPLDNAVHTIAVSCHVLVFDNERYFKDYLRGGIRIQEGANGELGTLGCLATTPPTPQDPKGKVVAIANQHVVSSAAKYQSNLIPRKGADPNSLTFKSIDGKPILPHSIIFIGFFRNLDLVGDAFYITAKGETLTEIAKGVAGAINTVALPGITAQQDPADATTVNVARTDGAGAYLQCEASGPEQPDPGVKLGGIVGTQAPFTHILTFFGEVSSDTYGIYVRINPGGTRASFGAFVSPAKGQNLNAIAEAVAKSINSVVQSINAADPAVNLTVNASPNGHKVTVTNAAEMECFTQSDVQVGQPDNSFGSPCSRCCSNRIGRVVDARFHLDIALIQLDPGIKYKPQIEELGIVSGATVPTLNMHVQKRGFMSGVTFGEIVTFGVNGSILARPGEFTRFYRNVMVIESTTKDTGGQTFRPFLLPGDSGSAVVTMGPGPVRIVGFLFGGGDETSGLAVPIDQVISGFSDLGLSFELAPGQDPNAVQTVPKPAIAFQALDPEADVQIPGTDFNALGLGATALGNRLSEVESEIKATRLGHEYADVVRRHFSEVLALVNNNRKVATVWQRSGGPELVNLILRAVQFREERLPSEINGQPVADCLARIQMALTRYASPEFSMDLSRYAPAITKFSGMTYREMLDALQSESPE